MASKNLVSNLKVITSGDVPTTSQLANGEFAFGVVDGVARLFGNVGGTIYEFSLVRSVAGKTGNVTLAKADVGLSNVPNVDATNASNIDSGSLAIARIAAGLLKSGSNVSVLRGADGSYTISASFSAPVTSVNSKTGAVVLSASDVSALPSTTKYAKRLAVSGKTVTLKDQDGTTLSTITTQDTTYGVATTSANGLMSRGDKIKLNGIASGAQVNTITGVKGNSETSYRTGNVNITKANIGLDNVPNVNCQSASNITSGTLALLRLATGLIVAGTNISVSRNSSTGAYTINSTGGASTPYVTTVSSWSGSNGNYYKQITAATHGKGTYPSVHTYVANGSLWEETYDSPAIDSSGNVTIYTNSAISIKVVIK